MIIPAIDLIDGKVVRLFQGDYGQKTEYQYDPLDVINRYAEQGAKWLHIVDLTGAKDTSKRQIDLIKAMVATGKMQFQAGGGIRSRQDVDQLLDIGCARVVIGSLAVKDPDTVMGWMQEYGPEKFVLALDVNINAQGLPMIATHGWQEDSGVELSGLVERYQSVGAEQVLCTDISCDGTLQGPNYALYQQLAQAHPGIIWQASGGIGALDHIAQVKATGAQSIILGRALLEGKFTLKEAIDLWPSGS